MAIDINLTPPPQVDNFPLWQQWLATHYTQVALAFQQIDATLQAANALLAGVPIGGMLDFSNDELPPGSWLWCDGSAVSRDTYSELFAVIGVKWGVGDSSTTFNLPDFRDRVMVGKGDMGGVDAALIDSVSTLNLGDDGGEDTHVLLQAELPNVALPIEWSNAAGINLEPVAVGVPSDGGSRYQTQSTLQENIVPSGTIMQTDSLGSGTAHNNLQPFAVATKIIRYA